MRTVLAIDEMLAHAIVPKLPGEVHALGHIEMRELKKRAIPRLREMVMERPSVLAIGGRAWDDVLDDLRELRLPYTVPVVVVAPSALFWQLADRAEAMRVFSLVATDREVNGAGLIASIYSEIYEAWQHRRRRSAALRLPMAAKKESRERGLLLQFPQPVTSSSQ